MRELEYHLCDVFTSTSLAGNQLAVFLNAGGLRPNHMQAIAREMNLSETTFVHRRDKNVESARGVRVRIFTTREELPFAGHPTLGTATAIRQLLPEYADAEAITLDLNAGQIPVRFPSEPGTPAHATFAEMRQLDPTFGATHEAAAVAPLLGLRAEDLAETAPQTVSTGTAFCIVVLRSMEALGRLRVDAVASVQYLRDSGARFFYALAPEADGLWRARMQFYGGEDPATGSAAGCAIAYLVLHGLWPSAKRLHLRQGIEISRPSDLYLSANLSGETVSEIRVAGSTVPVAMGRFFLA
ncbi:MAG TPA: PhzF family phenazine biosynthesis protein [Acidobacteriaceae bacterium]|jgi:trans-2,3-dihydro-3-hydroxyanthranilate isomerase|nr:PhzF family phenazine biosynthesis protein [Acidobacteriaceae bacterium]